MLYSNDHFYTILNYRKEPDGKFYIKYQVIGVNHVAVPTHFYKVIVGETPDEKFEMESYVMPNEVIHDDTPLSNFQVCIKEVNDVLSDWLA